MATSKKSTTTKDTTKKDTSKKSTTKKGTAKKNTNIFQNEYRTYDNIRQILHHMYLYGSYSAGDITASKLIDASSRTVSDHIKRIQNYINQMNPASSSASYVEKHKLPNRKTDKIGYRINNDFLSYPYNILAGTYRQCPINTNDLFFYLYLLTILSLDDSNNPYQHLPLKKNGITSQKIDSAMFSIEDCSNTEFYEDLLEGKYNFFSNQISVFSSAELYELIYALYEANYAVIQELENRTLPEAVIPLSKDQCTAKLDELVDLGILTAMHIQKSEATNNAKAENKSLKIYAINPPIFDSLDYRIDYSQFYSEVNSLSEYIRYYYCNAPISAPGYFLSEKLDKQLTAANENQFDRIISDNMHQISDCFIYDQPHYINILDDNICLELLTAIHSGEGICFRYQTSNYERSSTKTVIPIKIAIDRTYGRRYLIAKEVKVNYRANVPYLTPAAISQFRLDRIIEAAKPDAKITQLIDSKLVNAAFEEYSSNIADTGKEVLLHFSFSDDAFGKYMKNQLLTNNIYEGTITKKDDNHYDFQLITTDLAKLVPWLNSFGFYVSVDEKVSSELYKLIMSHTMEALSLYESI